MTKGIEFISDIKRPVPYSEDIKTVFTPRKYMTDDQRFAARRPDVLVFETDVLTEDYTLARDILAKLKVATTGTAADWIVKVIDVHPSDIAEDNDSSAVQSIHHSTASFLPLTRSFLPLHRSHN